MLVNVDEEVEEEEEAEYYNDDDNNNKDDDDDPKAMTARFEREQRALFASGFDPMDALDGCARCRGAPRRRAGGGGQHP